jgi:hypothetical protein
MEEIAKAIMFCSTDDGRLYLREQIDDPQNTDQWTIYVVNDPVTLTPEQLTRHESVIELLLDAGQAKRL